ncbi:MAG TPA: hypothetical protein DDX39_08865 [Bacteroidales bacterium]|nr:MAG: hypothetical protein A2W98_06330 [Bacteroidetes bacterium GWF2_33_38]OFY85977.1 MAG: hypothetical protein A2236_00840 [Bacteroidetes bacterium RIFOXYA2_FULL_33_7]HBF88738.1 hypothetical protein [Bacteroidales bacterium]
MLYVLSCTKIFFLLLLDCGINIYGQDGKRFSYSELSKNVILVISNNNDSTISIDEIFYLKKGKYFAYYENGNIKYEGEAFKNFYFTPYFSFLNLKLLFKGMKVKHGKWINYFKNGLVESIEYYKRGNFCNTWKYFNNDGSLIKEVTYENKKSVK